MTSKTYTQRGNCARAAKVALGKTAKPGVDFNIVQTGPNAFMWGAIAKAPKTDAPKKAKRVKGEARLQDQPQMVKLLRACSTKEGATIESLAELLGGIEQHTVRGAISRLKTEGVVFVCERVGRKKV